MSNTMIFSHLYPGWIAYFLAVLSPGPSVLAIASTAMTAGRKSSLVFALGVLTGSQFWGVMATVGLSTLISAYADILFLLKILAGLYLLYLSFRAFRSALVRDVVVQVQSDTSPRRLRSLYLGGLGLHLTNPKAIFAWIALVSLGLPKDAPASILWIFLAGCMFIGFVTFGGFALLFSMSGVLKGYKRSRRFIEGGMGLFFAFAGFKMIVGRV